MQYYFLLLCLLIMMPAMSTTPTVVTYRSGEHNNDQRFDFERALLQLALEKTQEQYGAFVLKQAPAMSTNRAIFFAQNNQIENFIFKLNYQQHYEQQQLGFINFPIHRGLDGYKICFTHHKQDAVLSNINSRYDLQSLSFGYEQGALDVDIMRQNGFYVEEVSSYQQLFQMVAKQRFDLYCRGIHEINQEYKNHQHLDDLVIDNYISLIYPLPNFFYSHKSNWPLLQRIDSGLQQAWQDGSYIALWRQHFRSSITLANLGDRKIFKLDNPYLQSLNNNYQQYLFIQSDQLPSSQQGKYSSAANAPPALLSNPTSATLTP